MQMVRLGQTGVKVSKLCLGCMTYGDIKWRSWVLPEAESEPFFRRAVEAGINFFDTADVYSIGVSEEITGRMLKKYAKRDEIVVATKVYNPMGPHPNQRGLSRKHILQGIDDSLRRLRMDYIDLYQIHRYDRDTPIEETLEALHDVVKAGKARYIGASSMFAWQFMDALHRQQQNGWATFVTMQNHYNLVYREEEREMLPLCAAMGIGVIPWSPLARGFLAGGRVKQGWGETERAKTDDIAQRMYYQPGDFAIAERVATLAEARGIKPAQMALAWILSKPVVTAPIVGASKMYQLDDALGALDVTLTEDEVRQLEEPYQPHPVLGHT
jgi:aryl-alcohol dehydrogenase-like predicted oxidoreductase